ncbi:MAG: cyclopropane-fatty-acyl-phospholipid synthase [Paracoccaceae bacterium]|jgi:cyclopropane-fatty-acyl-phospholipid synthase
MTILKSTRGSKNLPRYFSTVFSMAQKLEYGRIDFVLPDGRKFRAQGEKSGLEVQLIINNSDVFARLIREGDLGFCDAYIEGWWSTSDLQVLLDLLNIENDAVFNGFPGMSFFRLLERFRFWLKSNSRGQAKKNISYHYDLGNNFYELWLDKTMTYSSALFVSGDETLERAQTQKYARLIDQLGVKAGDQVLEIGCGWGGFAEYAAGARDMKVTCLTISHEQYKFAVDRIEKAGLQSAVTIKLQDYRDEKGIYDGIVSVEMFEAVGEKYWPVYFATVRDRLKPGAKAAFQIITINELRWKNYRKSVDFIQKYIFPGGMLPSPSVLIGQVNKAGLKVTDRYEFGESYSETLRRWHGSFNRRWSEVEGLGFDDRFRRMWNFYLTSCAGAFKGKNCDVLQITVIRSNT